MELEAGSGKAARRTGRLNNDRGPARMLTYYAIPLVVFVGTSALGVSATSLL